MNNVTGLVEDKLVLGGFLFDEAVLLARSRKHGKPSSSGWYCMLSLGPGVLDKPRQFHEHLSKKSFSILFSHLISALAMEVELLINAHHCQTLACNTEGISSILKLAQHCTRALAEANEYQHLVKYP
jgi:hypothetical protein